VCRVERSAPLALIGGSHRLPGDVCVSQTVGALRCRPVARPRAKCASPKLHDFTAEERVVFVA